MVLWLLAPVVKCSYAAFRDTPIGEIADQPESDRAVGQADKDRVVEGTGFFSKFGRAVKECYRETPLLAQERWKRNLLFGFTALTLLGWSLGYYERRKKRTFDR